MYRIGGQAESFRKVKLYDSGMVVAPERLTLVFQGVCQIQRIQSVI